MQYFVFVNDRSDSRVRAVLMHPAAVYLFLFCLLAASIGVARLMWFSATFSLGKIGVHNERSENEVLRGRIDFLDGFISRETLKLDSLVAFEDRMRLTYGMNPISTDVRKAGIGGVPSPAEKEEGTITDVLTKRSAAMLEGLSMLLRRAQLQHTTFGEMSAYVGQRYRYWSQSPSIWPASGTVTSGFGYRTDPMNGETMFHDGLDIANRTGTPVFAPADGVIKTRGVFQDFGNAVIIAHPESGIETIYGHLDKAFVEEQQFVKRGELVGYVGSSGKSTGPHLHYEIRKSGCAVNPGPYILPADQITD